MLQPSLSNGIKFGKINAGTAKNKKKIVSLDCEYNGVYRK